MAESVTRELALHREPAVSIIVSRDGDHDAAKALPRSQISFRALPGKWTESSRGLKLQIVEVTMPEWLAIDRGLA